MKDECGEKVISEFFGLRAKLYAYKMDGDGEEAKNARGSRKASSRKKSLSTITNSVCFHANRRWENRIWSEVVITTFSQRASTRLHSREMTTKGKSSQMGSIPWLMGIGGSRLSGKTLTLTRDRQGIDKGLKRDWDWQSAGDWQGTGKGVGTGKGLRK